MKNVLVMVPTYNECDNVEIIADRIRRSVPKANLLFIDDSSPDGTGQILDELALTDAQIIVTHRPRKMGIGSAHLHAIFKAYSENYGVLVTLDADLTHSPENINTMISSLNLADVATSSRFLNRSDLDGWNLRRKATTHLGHLLTRVLLGLPYDSSSGFRAYNLSNIPEKYFEFVESSGYSFFFESLKILDLNQVSIVDVPMNLPPRTYGSSKMKLKDILGSIKILIIFAYETKVHKEKFLS